MGFLSLSIGADRHANAADCPAADISIGLLHVITAGFGIENSVPAVPGRVQAAVNGVSGTVGGAKLAGAAQGGKGELIGGRAGQRHIGENGGQTDAGAKPVRDKKGAFPNKAKPGMDGGRFVLKSAGILSHIMHTLRRADRQGAVSLPFNPSGDFERQLIQRGVDGTVMLIIGEAGAGEGFNLIHDAVAKFPDKADAERKMRIPFRYNAVKISKTDLRHAVIGGLGPQ